MNLINIIIFSFFECLIIGGAIYLTTLFTLRVWHCYKNVKVDPINAIKKRDISVAKAEELKQNYESIISLG
jgi:hypothetical protein